MELKPKLALQRDLYGFAADFEREPYVEGSNVVIPPPESAPIVSADLLAVFTKLIRAGRAEEALERLEATGAEFVSAPLRKLHRHLRRGLRIMHERAPDRLARGESTCVVALGCALDILAASRSAPAAPRRLDGVALITGHLGAGGAEHQMARTAEMLSAAAAAKQKIAGLRIAGPIHVVVKSLAPEPGRPLNFFLPRLARKGIPVWQMDGMPPVTPEDVTSDEDLAALLSLLGANVSRGLCMTPWFRERGTAVAYLWQDNPILHFALAAMLAGVPRLVLNLRGLPPVLRWKEHLTEYRELYSHMARTPGVTFVTNSSAAADAYAEWIGCPRDVFHVILNGASAHASHPPAREIKAWADFEARTAGASITVGGIFRMHPNKRPLEWIQFARRYLDIHPKARFILIGSGIFFEAVKELVGTLALKDRLLMIRQTRAGAFWLSKMNVFVLLSRYEGTPNVLIEAQLAGVPVVCTPVANTRDTFVEGVTGLATSSAEGLDIEDVVSKVDRVAAFARVPGGVRLYAQRHIASRFSPRSMIEHTVSVLTGRDGTCCFRSVAGHVEPRRKRSGSAVSSAFPSGFACAAEMRPPPP
jgi:glycosyltransferase involved in cell wall biosynthesis